jgi:hypothetical protein
MPKTGEGSCSFASPRAIRGVENLVGFDRFGWWRLVATSLPPIAPTNYSTSPCQPSGKAFSERKCGRALPLASTEASMRFVKRRSCPGDRECSP